ncbi:hypothetical protein [Urbifossiella limnaea]|uniref:Nucleotidyltransferase n=1 Tax=Urbifossiella limnaea TaxID=2528023 RepID=A0A517XQS9_9BACT|nr:hypothetical protein [Urbifossiella limnaea]QDU19839.1 hypothetical protein ETAA1_17770 [Urbifossiella limnaea]
MAFGDFPTFYSKARERSVAGVFDEFLDQHINITRGIRNRAGTSQNHLREFLADETDRDEGFPRVLSIEDWDFLGGSFARHTKIWPLDDIDVYLPLDGTGLVYTGAYGVLPYTVVNDGVLDENPLLVDRKRWMDGYNLSSEKLIDGFAKILRRHYPETTKVRRVGEAVNVRLTVGAGEDNDGLGFDVVPCFSLKPVNYGQQPFYLIPNGDDGWIHTNPRIDQEYSDNLNRANGRTLRKGVKLFKWWNGEFAGGRVESYYAELAVMRAFQMRNAFGQTVTTIAEAAEVAFRAVRDAINAGDQQPLLNGAPTVERGPVTNGDMTLLNAAVTLSQRARQLELYGRQAEAIGVWGQVFGEEFPTA